ncbi:hypothetical protein QLQ12_20535 [Actinoplanes sp. NEAU-A12]|uniref:MFS transporter n=1 Tax=Actinoplanes sandaracinus TaxID=3045177 RepID=A0ABT6WMN4_9ACTN|nr:hypothetical protein [Actinoplanes sandaracinus]MDI6101004.1 hypothetical protein [Actinoplanes sandaracinus]
MAALHALGEAWQSIAQVITDVARDPHLFTVLSWGGLVVVSLAGIAWLLPVRRHADREPPHPLWRIPVTR